MTTHTVTATLTVEIADPRVLKSIPGVNAAGDDERAQLQAAATAGLRELQSMGGRYGFRITDATATVS